LHRKRNQDDILILLFTNVNTLLFNKTVSRRRKLLFFQALLGNALNPHADRPPKYKSAPNVLITTGGFVKDNGIGIVPENLEQVSQCSRGYTQGKYTPAPVWPGNMQEKHGASCVRIWVESDPGQGATGYFMIPAHPLLKDQFWGAD